MLERSGYKILLFHHIKYLTMKTYFFKSAIALIFSILFVLSCKKLDENSNNLLEQRSAFSFPITIKLWKYCNRETNTNVRQNLIQTEVAVYDQSHGGAYLGLVTPGNPTLTIPANTVNLVLNGPELLLIANQESFIDYNTSPDACTASYGGPNTSAEVGVYATNTAYAIMPTVKIGSGSWQASKTVEFNVAGASTNLSPGLSHTTCVCPVGF
jgi:hypothetical protein